MPIQPSAKRYRNDISIQFSCQDRSLRNRLRDIFAVMKFKGFGPRLRSYRMRKGHSLQKLADLVGASKAHIYELETGKSKNPSLALLTSLAQALDVPIKDLVGESTDTADDEKTKLVPLFRDLRELPDDALDLIQALTRKLREQHEDAEKHKNRSD